MHGRRKARPDSGGGEGAMVCESAPEAKEGQTLKPLHVHVFERNL